jgi:trehalose/maltose hydrolase-like predicted phosphorylase
VVIAGDEFGPVGGLPGSDSLLTCEVARGPVFSVGPEPNGVPPGVVHIGGGPAAFLGFLLDQLGRRERKDAPEPADDRGWTITIDGIDPELERAHAALLTLADGRIGTLGSPVWRHTDAAPRVFAAGIYEGSGAATQLVKAPVWSQLARDLPAGARIHRRLNLHEGVQHQELTTNGSGAHAVLLSSAARPGVVVLRATGQSRFVSAGAPLRTTPGAPAEEGRLGASHYAIVAGAQGGVGAAVREQATPVGLDRIGAYVTDSTDVPTPAMAADAAAAASDAGFERLLCEHRAAWASRWATADVGLQGDDELQVAVRFALFHLIGSASSDGEAVVGARGLTGDGYRGHVFWDTDVFVLPFLAATHPPAARAVLEYRIRRLPAALAAAREHRLDGARFPWESAHEGRDVTPRSVRDHTGRLVRIRTGEREEHIVADVAWAAATYVEWTGDEDFAAGPGLRLLVETVRYWASRVRFDEDGHAHIYGVIGPDEYHEPVDDNAYTNLMARWNLRAAAAALVRYDGDAGAEAGRWRDIADALADGFDAATGVHEEFAGFHRLEPLVLSEVAPNRPVAADLLLGKDRVAAAQVLKQADVLMAHHLIPEALPAGSLANDLAFYEPRTAHGSSLSPAVHAALLARAGRLGRATRALRLAAMVDVDDLTNTTAGGLHLATMGGVWQALVFGFAGIRPKDGTLVLSPRLPEQWQRLTVRLRYRGAPLRVVVDHEHVDVQSDRDVNWKVDE